MKRSERYLVAIFDTALRGLVGIGRVVGTAAAVRPAAVVGTTAAGPAFVIVVLVGTMIGSTATAVTRPTIICGFCDYLWVLWVLCALHRSHCPTRCHLWNLRNLCDPRRLRPLHHPRRC